MMHISLVCTVHEEKGLANITALIQILAYIRPEVIFLEVPTSLNEKQIRSGIQETLELKAVKIYHQTNSVELIPVDLPTPELALFSNNQSIHARIERDSLEYCRIVDWHSDYVQRYGFAYLNSIYCENIFSELDLEIDKAVEKMNEAKITADLESWNKVIERRELEMLNNIRKYSCEHDYERGVFLVGAAHRRSIMKIVEGMGKIGVPEIVWDYLGSENDQGEGKNTE